MHSGKLILIVDDDSHIREVVRFALEKAGFVTAEASDGMTALGKFQELGPDLIVLDILMPEMDGTEVCRRIRAGSPVPIVFLSSKDEEVDRIVGLELGGDDYVAKPFSPRELVARVRAVLRRSDRTDPPQAGKIIRHGQLSLDGETFRAYWGDREVVLTVTEFGIVRALMGHPGKVYSREELMDRAYATENIVTDRTIDSHVRRVRKKFADMGGDPVETVHGLGYRLGPCAESNTQ
ncbi:MAG: response regulator transcription factor [Thermodesulfobacteriota bacterium]